MFDSIACEKYEAGVEYFAFGRIFQLSFHSSRSTPTPLFHCIPYRGSITIAEGVFAVFSWLVSFAFGPAVRGATTGYTGSWRRLRSCSQPRSHCIYSTTPLSKIKHEFPNAVVFQATACYHILLLRAKDAVRIPCSQ
jgi:hypothetical protein